MKEIEVEVKNFLQAQGFIIVSTLDQNGTIHNACKDIVEIEPEGRIYLLDLYHGVTYKNLSRNPGISIAAVDEHKFKGFCLKGRARVLTGDAVNNKIIKAWEDRITTRLAQRVLKNIGGSKGHPRHPEVLLPPPKYLIAMEVDEVIDLAPSHIK
jgi:predicted pyridoxine 5'-phosphate oxidase superfamily flavin-nucleotide-binding protein